MKNNQLHGPDHALDIKEIIKNHPTLSYIDFSNNEMNINKNKLKNIGVQAIVEGILESDEQGCSLISAINLSSNLLTSDCLRQFARLSDPSFVQLNSLNLSYNDLGQDSILTLQPILSEITELNLASTKLSNKSLMDFVGTFKKQEMKLQTLDIHSNLITTEGFYKLMVCLKANNKVKKLNISHNKIANDLKMFR